MGQGCGQLGMNGAVPSPRSKASGVREQRTVRAWPPPGAALNEMLRPFVN